MKKVIILLGAILLMMCFLVGCSADESIDDECIGGFGMNKEDCSRNHIMGLTTSEFSGTGFADDVHTALKFVYENEEMKEKYGADFDVDAPFRTKKGTITLLIPYTTLYKGKTTCYISIKEDRWIVAVEKSSYFGKWEVDDYHLYSDADGKWYSPDDDPDIENEEISD